MRGRNLKNWVARASVAIIHFASNPCEIAEFIFRSGKTDSVQFTGLFKQGPFAYKNGRFASSFLLSGVGLL